MLSRNPIRILLVLAAALALPAAGCRSASTATTVAAGAAGAAAAIVLNDQNAEADIAGSIGDVDRRARVVLSGMGLQIVQSSSENNAMEREYEARSGDRVVHVKLEQRAPGLTKASVSSRTGTTLNYDVSHARMVVERIQQQR